MDEILSLTDLQKLKLDCSYWNDTDHNDDNGDKRHFHCFIWRIVKPYMNSVAFTVQDFNTLSHIEKLYCFEFMTDSAKFIEFAFKTPATLNTLPGIRLEFIEKQDKTLVKKFVNSADFTIDIFKVLDRDVKIYIILLFNSTRAIDYLFKKTDDITNFSKLYTEYKLRNKVDDNCPKDDIYIYYPFLLLRALKAHKKLFSYINNSNFSTSQLSFLQTNAKIYYITYIIKDMLKIHQTQKKYVPGLNPFLSVTKKLKTKGKKDGVNISILGEDNFNNIGEALYKDYRSLLKTPSLFDKLKELIKVITNYKERNNAELETLNDKLMSAYKLKELYDIPEEPDLHGNQLGDTINSNNYYDFFAQRTFEEYKIINEFYTNNDVIITSPNSKSSATNHHYEKLLLSAKLDKPILQPRHIINVGRP
jgi:hypothetical protein